MTRTRQSMLLLLATTGSLPLIALSFSAGPKTSRQQLLRHSFPSQQNAVLHGNHMKLFAGSTIESDLDQALDDANLRKAVRLLNDNPDTDLTRERWNKIFMAIEERTANAEENTENLRQAAEFPLESAARSEMTTMYDALKRQDKLQLYGAISTKMPIAAGSSEIPPALMESILNMPMTALTPKQSNSLLIAGVAVATLEAVLSLGTGIPLNLLVFSTLFATVADRLFLNGALFESFLKLFSPGIQTKILKHEAGHFLAAYLLGCPVEGIVLSAWAALQDRRFGSRQVSAGTSFFDPELSAQINGQAQVTRSAVDRYSIIVMAGIAAEASEYGQADGGAGDEMALVSFLSRLNGGGRLVWDSEKVRNQARWGALQAVLMMRAYKPAYDALVDALERGGTLGDCIYAIEKAARDNNLKPLEEPIGYITMDQKWSKENPVQVTVQQSQAVPSSPPKPEAFDGEASLATLREYKAQMEEKLRSVEQKLNELEKNK